MPGFLVRDTIGKDMPRGLGCSVMALTKELHHSETLTCESRRRLVACILAVREVDELFARWAR